MAVLASLRCVFEFEVVVGFAEGWGREGKVYTGVCRLVSL